MNKPYQATEHHLNNYYLLRKKDEPQWYIHYINGSYIEGLGTIGACFFDKKNADLFIKQKPSFEKILLKDAPKEYNPALDKLGL